MATIAERHAEIKGEWTFPALDGFTLVGRPTGST